MEDNPHVRLISPCNYIFNIIFRLDIFVWGREEHKKRTTFNLVAFDVSFWDLAQKIIARNSRGLQAGRYKWTWFG